MIETIIEILKENIETIRDVWRPELIGKDVSIGGTVPLRNLEYRLGTIPDPQWTWCIFLDIKERTPNGKEFDGTRIPLDSALWTIEQLDRNRESIHLRRSKKWSVFEWEKEEK